MAQRGIIAYDQIRSANRHGNASQFQMFTGTSTTSHVAIYDASGNLIDGGGAPLITAPVFETNSVQNSNQGTLNLIAGTNVTLTAGTGGNVTIAATSGGAGATYSVPYIVNGTNSYGPVWSLTTPPTTGWTWDNQGVSTVDTTLGYNYYHFGAATGAADIRTQYRTAPTTPYTFTLALSAATGFGHGGEVMYCFGFRSATGQYVTLMLGVTGNSNGLLVTRWNSSVSFSANTVTDTNWLPYGLHQPIFWRIKDDGTNIIFYYSIDGGNHFQQLYTEARAAFLTGGPTGVAIGGYINSQTIDVALWSWVQG